MSEITESSSLTTQRKVAEISPFSGGFCEPQVSYSTIATEEVKRLAIQHYGLPRSLQCVFYHRGTNDVYQLSMPDRRFAVRISRVNWMTRSALAAELAVLDHIRAKGVEVTVPVSRTDGDWITEIMAPEGLRRAIVTSWANGSAAKYDSEAHVRQFGRLLARVHAALDDMAPLSALPKMNTDYLLRSSLTVIYQAMGAYPDLLKELTELAHRLESRLALAHTTLQDWGLCHGDIANHNVRIDGDSGVLFDFEFCGWGWRLFDLASFRLHARCEGLEIQAWKPFIREYLALRPNAESSIKHVGLFMCLRYLWIAAKRIDHLVEFGTGSLPDTYFETLVRLCKEMELEFM